MRLCYRYLNRASLRMIPFGNDEGSYRRAIQIITFLGAAVNVMLMRLEFYSDHLMADSLIAHTNKIY